MKVLTIAGVPLELLEIHEVAESLGLSTETVRREIWRKKLGQFKMCGRVYVKKEQLDAYVVQCTHAAAAE
jgi:excisionase family DNA binding protein